MLVITRRVGEMVQIGDDVEVRILAVHGNQVRIGIEAPKDMRILREELIGRDQPVDYEKE